MGALPSHHVTSHSFSDGTAINVVVSPLGGAATRSVPHDGRTLSLSYEVHNRNRPEYIYDFDREIFELRGASSDNELQGIDNVAAWLEGKRWSGNENFPANFLDVFVRMVADAVTKMWPETCTILVTAVIDMGFVFVEEPELMERASGAVVEALEKVFILEGGGTTSCAICLEEFPFKAEALSMPCSHAFHRACIVGWLGGHSTCPMCRFQLPSN